MDGWAQSPEVAEHDVTPSCNRTTATYDDMVTARLLDHICHKFCSDGRSALVLLILPRIGKEWDHRSDPLCARNLASMDHDTKLHKRSIYRATASVDDVHIVLAHGLLDPYLGLANPAASNFCFRQG